MTALEALHLSPPIAAALTRLGWSADDALTREAAPTAARGHNLVLVLPPSPTAATPALAGLLTRLGAGRPGLVLAPAGQLDEWGRVAHRVSGDSGLRIQVAHGTSRATRRLREEAVDLLIATPETALALQRRSALRADGLAAVLLAWPEAWEEEESLSPLMQDLDKEAQRIVLTSDAERGAALVERYARRALTVGAAGSEAGTAGPVRTVSVSWGRRIAGLSDLVELLDPTSLVVWTLDQASHEAIAAATALREPEGRVVTGDAPKAQVIIAFDLPSAEQLRQLVSAGEVVLLVPPGTERYVERIAAPRRPLRLPGALDAATTAAAARRAAIVRALETGTPDRALLTLAPLFERHDPAAVAAALFELWTSAAGATAPAALPDIPATARVYVGIGKKDGATVNDLVAVLTKDVRLERAKIGRVELRDAFMLVELPAQEAERVASALNGTTIRRRRITARVDRGGPTARPAAGGRPAAPRRPARPPEKR
ncbi:MAG TPA: DbpA RNA binding domain-containing protein [Gemmatimonadales bacterium]|nr:DbpA RNA binding domain-containing protein [Gemmatimonadales bacterium]